MSDYSAYIDLKSRITRALSPYNQHKRTCVVPYHYSVPENTMYALVLVEHKRDGSYVSTKPIMSDMSGFDHPWTTGMQAVFRHLGAHMKPDDRAIFSSLASISTWDGQTGTTFYFVDVYNTCPYLYDAIEHAHTHVDALSTTTRNTVSLVWEECNKLKGIVPKMLTDILDSLYPKNVTDVSNVCTDACDTYGVLKPENKRSRWDS